ncbi:MAG: gephyrin-like molybdotransferase Glp [Flavobacteriaceae bacterium]
MIGVTEALELISSTAITQHTKQIKLSKALNMVLANDVVSPINMPPFRQSAMDGYAIHLCNTTAYTLIDEIKAGDNLNPELNCGEAVRIFTGAPVPDTATAVVMQEHITTNGNSINLQKLVVAHDNIRPKGEQIKQGDVALKKGTKLNPAGIGYLATLGITTVEIFQQPKITIVVTGNELTPPGEQLHYGQIYESNSVMLFNAIKNLGYDNIAIQQVNDDYHTTKTIIDTAIKTNDIVLLTGGISVGDYDFVGKALHDLQVDTVFYKVKQKPGKPLFFGTKHSTPVFALPGNPAAALTCFYIYVYPILLQMAGEVNSELPKTTATSVSTFEKKGGRAQFLKAIETNGEVTILEGQSSAMLHTFALANALVLVPEEQQNINIGDLVQVIRLPQ